MLSEIMPKKLRSPKGIEESDLLIARRVKSIFKEGGLTQEELASELAISQPHVSRLLGGRTAWRKGYLQRVAELYGTSINALLLDPQEVPIVAHLEDDQGFNYAAINHQSVWVGKAAAPPGEYNLANLYCLQIEGDYFAPFLTQGTLVYARKDRVDIQENMLAIYTNEEGYGLLRQVNFVNDTIVLRSLSPSGKYIIRPNTYLKLLDKVEWIKI
jgi:transcriptional regulator with XRE-family HTH domain